MGKKDLLHKEVKGRVYVLDDRKLLIGLLSDCYSNEKAKINQLIAAYDSGIITRLLEKSSRDEFLRQRFISEIKQNYGYADEIAEWIIDTWLFCIDEGVKTEREKYLEEKRLNLDILNISNSLTDINRIAKQNFHESLGQSSGVCVPCGVGNDDRGFIVQGIYEAKDCINENESFFAVIFNYLQRNSRIDEKIDKPIFIKQYEMQLTFELEYRRIYRLMIIILLMVKNNYSKENVVSFNYDGDTEEIRIAIMCINNYLAILCRLAGVKNTVRLRHQKNTDLTITLRDTSGDITISEYEGSNAKRVIWGAKRIIYKLSDKSEVDLEYFLTEISPYKSFNPGQFQVLKSMLCKQAHTICIMPTGSGKSLIYYFCSILQPGLTFIISPTELLIDDQIYNLKKYHRIDDVKHLQYGLDDNFKDFIPKNKIHYLTPETFQNRDLLKEFIHLNSGKKIANLVLDEVHCISNWSHDFRPEYLMLSTYLNRYLDRTYFKCFTATANYSVVKDVKNQLQINNDENIISPINLERGNTKYEFVSCDSLDLMIDTAIRFLKNKLIKGEKTIVFTKNDEISRMFHEALKDIKYDAAVYNKLDRRAYRVFTEGQCKALIASEELGIGVNLSGVNNILHFGLPISKGEYVQEIGRAGRNGEKSSSLVVYLECNSKNVNEKLLHRNTKTDEIISLIQDAKVQNDYTDTYKKIIGSMTSREVLNNLLFSTYELVKPIDEYAEIEFDIDRIDVIKRCLFILFAIGYLHNWSFCDINYNHKKIRMLIAKSKENQSLDKIKEKARNYLYLLGGDKKYISILGDARSVDEIIVSYVEWYFDHFIYHHKEQFLDMLSFFESYGMKDGGLDKSREINNRLASYFSLSMLDISIEEEKYISLSYKEISETIISGIEYKTVSNIQRINQDNYNVKLDYFLFIYTLINDKEYDSSRMNRILECLDPKNYYDFIESLSTLYGIIILGNRLLLFKDLSDYVEKHNEDFRTFFDIFYRRNPKDIIYFGVMANRINSKYGEG